MDAQIGEQQRRPAGYSAGGFGKETSLSRSYVYDLLKAGVIRSVKIGSRTVIPASELDRLLSLDDE